MPLEPPSSAGWPPDKIVNAITQLTAQQREADRRQRWILIVAVVSAVIAVVSLIVAAAHG